MKKIDKYTLMVTTVVDFCNNPIRIAITDSVPALRSSVDVVAEKNAEIKSALAKQQETITGFAVSKKRVRANLCDISASLLAPAYAYAKEAGNDSLAQKLAWPKWKIKKIVAEELAPAMRAFHDLLVPLLPSLAPYNITSANMLVWNNAIEDMVTVNATPNIAIAIKKQETELLKKMLSEIISYCRFNLDKVVQILMITESNYYQQYKNMRKLKPYGNKSTLLRINVVRVETNQPVFEATVSILGKELIATTDLAGRCNLHTPYGIHQIRVAAPGFVTYLSDPIEFKKGKRVTLNNISLLPDNFNLNPIPGITAENNNGSQIQTNTPLPKKQVDNY